MIDQGRKITFAGLGDKLRAIRGERSQKDFAAGMPFSEGAYAKYEQRSSAPAYALAAIAAREKVPLGDLMPPRGELSPESSPKNGLIHKNGAPDDSEISLNCHEEAQGEQSGSDEVPYRNATLVELLSDLDTKEAAEAIRRADRLRGEKEARKAVENPILGRRTS